MAMKRKILSLLLAVVMATSMFNTAVFAASAAEAPKEEIVADCEICGHIHDQECGFAEAVPGQPCSHVHDESCGFVEGSEGVSCNHKHTEDCYQMITNCIHNHTDECYPVVDLGDTPVETTPDDAAEDLTVGASSPDQEPEPTECTHMCSEENGCVTKQLQCPHEHNTEECGYVAPTEGVPCNHEHSAKCGYVAAVSGTPCRHVCLPKAMKPLSAPFANNSVTVTTWADLETAIENAVVDTEISISGTVSRAYANDEITLPTDITITLNGTPDAKIFYSYKTIAKDGFIIPNGATLKITGSLTVEATDYNTAKEGGLLNKANVFKVTEDGSLIIDGDLAAHTSTAYWNGNYGTKSFVDSSGSVEITENGSVSGWTVYDAQTNQNAALLIHGAGASLTLNGGRIFGNYNMGPNRTVGSAVHVREGAAFTMNSGKISENGLNGPQEKGAGVYVHGTDSTFTMNGGEIVENRGNIGAGVAVESGAVFTMKDGSISNNVFCHSNHGGGAVYVSNATFHMTAPAVIQNNKPEAGIDQKSGAGVYVTGTNSVFTMDGGEISGNVGEGDNNYGGGGVFVENGTTDLKNGVISGNKVGTTKNCVGGGIKFSYGTATLENMTITNNEVSPSANPNTGDNGIGGGIGILRNTTLTMIDCTISNNKAGTMGGGIFAQKNATITMENCTVSENSSINGGGILIAAAKGFFKNVTISKNECSSLGGGVAIDNNTGSESVTFKDCTITENNAAGDGACGGGICLLGGTATLEGTTKVSGNEAPIGKAAIVNTGATFNLKDQAAIAGDNDVALEDEAFITVANSYTGASPLAQIPISSANEDVESGATPGTPLVFYSEAAGGAEEAQKAAEGYYFIPSEFMPKTLQIGQSKIETTKDYLTYVANDAGYVTVTFDGNGGTWTDESSQKTMQIPNGAKVPDIAKPDNGERVFKGWNTNVDGNGTEFNADTPVTASITVYAQWEEVVIPDPTYTVAYNANGGGGTLTDPNSPYKEGDLVTVLANTFTNTGKSFIGWNDGEGNSYTAGESFAMPAKNVILYAQWEDKVIPSPTYTVTYDANGGRGKAPADPTEYTENAEVTVLANTFTNGTKSFIGWKDEGGKSYEVNSIFSMPAKNITLYAQWKSKGGGGGGGGGGTTVYYFYDLTFETNGGSPMPSVSVAQYTTVQLTQDPSRDGYTFEGWYVDRDLTEKAVSVYMDGDKTIYAKWTKNAVAPPVDSEKPTNSSEPSESSSPTEPTPPTEPGKPSKPDKLPQTSDASMAGFWLMMVILSGAGLVWINRKKRCQ